jgi:hypothetical protein
LSNFKRELPISPPENTGLELDLSPYLNPNHQDIYSINPDKRYTFLWRELVMMVKGFQMEFWMI